MKKLSSPFYASILAAAVSASSIAMADQVADAKAEAEEEGNNYFGVAGQLAKTDFDELNAMSTSGIRLSVGRDIGSDLDEEGKYDDMLGIEAHVAFGVDVVSDEAEEIVDNEIVNTTADTDIVYGLYVRGNAPISDSLMIYGLLGYGAAEVTIDFDNGDKVELDESGVSYGLGVQFDLNETLALGVDWVAFDLGDDVDFYTVNAGVVYKF